MIGALDSALQGMLKAERQANDAARGVLKATSESANTPPDGTSAQPQGTTGSLQPQNAAFGGDVLQELVNLRQSELAFKANAKVFKAADETLGSLLDATS